MGERPLQRFSQRSRCLPFLALCLGLVVWTACSFGSFPAVGTQAPLSENKVLKAGMKPKEVCSLEPFRDAALHRWTVKAALEQKMPVVVVFGTPQHCTECVQQIETLNALAEMYRGVAFIHIDEYADEKTVKEWNVKGEPWTALIDRNGIIRYVFNGPTLFQEIEPKIREVLKIPVKTEPEPKPQPEKAAHGAAT